MSLSQVFFDDMMVVVTESKVVQKDSYYPFGLSFSSYQRVTAKKNKYLFNGIERIDDLGIDLDMAYYPAYDPAVGRWLQIDPKASERESPYVGFANMPNFFIDPLGDTINLSGIIAYDNANDTHYADQIVSDLTEITGLILSIDSKTGDLNYAKDSDGNAVVTTESVDCLCTYEEKGSSSARSDLVSAIDGAKVSVGAGADRSGTPHGGNNIFLSPTQINGFIDGTSSNMNDKTMGFGMTFLHEYQHTGPGGSKGDVSSSTNTANTGPTVDRINIYRKELDIKLLNNKQYGQRDHYNAVPRGNGGSVRFNLYKIKNGKKKNASGRISF